MKRKSIIALLLVFVCLLSACAGNKDTNITDNNESSYTPDQSKDPVVESAYSDYGLFPVEYLYDEDDENYTIFKEVQGSITNIEHGGTFPAFLVGTTFYIQEYGQIIKLIELNETPDDILYFDSIELGDNLYSYFDGKITNYDPTHTTRFENIEFNPKTDFISKLGMSSFFFLTSKQEDGTYLNKYYEGADGNEMSLHNEQIIDEFENAMGDTLNIKDVVVLKDKYNGYMIYCITEDNELYKLGNSSRHTFEMSSKTPIVTDVQNVYAPDTISTALVTPIYSKLYDNTTLYSVACGEDLFDTEDNIEISFMLPDGHKTEEIKSISDLNGKLVVIFDNNDVYVSEEILDTREAAYSFVKLDGISKLMNEGKVKDIAGTTLSARGDNLYVLMNDGILYYYEFRL